MNYNFLRIIIVINKKNFIKSSLAENGRLSLRSTNKTEISGDTKINSQETKPHFGSVKINPDDNNGGSNSRQTNGIAQTIEQRSSSKTSPDQDEKIQSNQVCIRITMLKAM